MIIEYRIPLKVFNDWQEFLHLDITPEHFKQFHCVHALSLFKGLEYNILWWNSFISNWPFDLAQIMSSHGSKLPSSADVLMQLVLQVNERVVCGNIEFDVTDHTPHDKWSHLRHFWLHSDLHQFLVLVLDLKARQLVKTQVASERCSDSLNAEQIVPIGCNFDLVDHLL